MNRVLSYIGSSIYGIACSIHRGGAAYFSTDHHTDSIAMSPLVRLHTYAPQPQPEPERWDVSEMTTRLLLIHGVVGIMKHNLIKYEGSTLKVDVYVRRKNQTKGRTAEKVAAICKSVDPNVVYKIVCIQ